MSQRGIIAYAAEEKAPTYLEPGVDASTEGLRSLVRSTFLKSEDVSRDARARDELNVLVTASTRQLAALYFLPVDAE